MRQHYGNHLTLKIFTASLSEVPRHRAGIVEFIGFLYGAKSWRNKTGEKKGMQLCRKHASLFIISGGGERIRTAE
jgi:hypothetical protein